MKRSILFAAFLSLLLLGFNTAQAQVKKMPEEEQAVTIRDQIMVLHEKLDQSCTRNDVVALSNLFTSDAQILREGSDIERGTGGVQSFFFNAFRFGVRQVRLNAQEIDGDGNLAFETGTVTLLNAQGQIIKQGPYMMIFKRIDNVWKIYRLMSTNASKSPQP